MLSLLLLPLLLPAALLAGIPGDDPLIAVVRKVVATADSYLEDHQLSSLSLPDLGVLPLDPVKLTRGTLSQLNTIQLVGTPTVSQAHNSDNSTTYTFDVTLSLEIILVKYDFHVKLLSLDGEATLTPQLNSARAKGIVVVGPGTACDAKLYSAGVVSFKDFQISIEPDDFTVITEVSEIILNYVSPKLLPLTNTVINAALLLPQFQEKFSDLICKSISS